MRVLLIEDDLSLNQTIAKYLSKEGYEVLSCYDTEYAKKMLGQQKFDLLLLDVKLPGESGFEFLEHFDLPPTIFITSLSSVEDVTRGFKAGAIEYIKKPFYLKELKLRIEALLKRVDKPIECGDFKLYPQKSQLTIDGHNHHLTPKECELLLYFIQYKNRLIPKERILYDLELTDLALRTHIKNLRKIVGDKITTIKGEGYHFVCK